MPAQTTVVIVSSSHGTQQSYTRQLRDAQVAALGVGSWRDVLDLARGMSLGAVLVDVATASDWQSCRMLRERQEMTGVPVVALSDWAAPDRRYRTLAWSVGCSAYVAKPCSSDTILQALGRVRNGERGVEVAPVLSAARVR